MSTSRSRRRHRSAEQEQPVRVRVRGPGDLVAALPALLGYHASRSIVLVLLGGGTGGRLPVIQLTMRLDIPDCAEGEPAGHVVGAVATTLAAGAQRVQADHAMLVLLDGTQAFARDLAGHLDTALGSIGVRLLDTVVVSDGRYVCLHCDDVACCPPDGLPVPATSALTTAAVVQGTVIHSDRDGIAAEVAGPTESEARRARTVAALLLSTAAHAQVDEDEGCLEDLLDAGAAAAAGSGLSLDSALRCALALRVGDFRDRTYAHMLTRGAEQHRILWSAVCRQVPPELSAAPLAIAALAAYLSGAGTLATEAVVRAEAEDAGHPTVRLVADILAAGVPPGAVRAALAEGVLPGG